MLDILSSDLWYGIVHFSTTKNDRSISNVDLSQDVKNLLVQGTDQSRSTKVNERDQNLKAFVKCRKLELLDQLMRKSAYYCS